MAGRDAGRDAGRQHSAEGAAWSGARASVRSISVLQSRREKFKEIQIVPVKRS